ncbi:hypothetical protein TNCT_225051 [Trichonephila clavata]|uniref:Uncharacterized protein n=1 Tax=Trichonephila clavata TaxID=2740835 RepID=A0A8X6JXN2_TRICU|nr:hypothetical protein TNCT_225051 [Trichonephila clavata]
MTTAAEIIQIYSISDLANDTYNIFKSSLTSLWHLRDLSWNRIEEIYEDGFVSLTRLQELNIANNHLELIPGTAFHKLTTLRTLHLQNNKFRSIPSISFAPLVNLENLYLSYNNLELPSEDTFALLPRLKKLWLDGTNLFEIPVKSLFPLTKLEYL